MLYRRVTARKQLGTPDRIFHWGGLQPLWFPKLYSIVLVGGFFTFLITSIEIQVVNPEDIPSQRASLIYLENDTAGRALKLLAEEGGPFPSRFELSQWDGLKGLETAALMQIAIAAPVYEPKKEALPQRSEIQSFALAREGESFFPEISGIPAPVLNASSMKLAPMIYPLSGITEEELPSALPLFEVEVNTEMAAETWRFLLQLNAHGSVMECVSLENGYAASASELGKWLHACSFAPARGEVFRWIAVGIEFTNQDTHEIDAD